MKENWELCDRLSLSHSPERSGESPAVVVCGVLSPLTQVTVVPAAIVRSSSSKLRISELMVVGSGIWVGSGGTGVCVAANAVGEGGTDVEVGGTEEVGVAAMGAGVGVPVELSNATTVSVAVINGFTVSNGIGVGDAEIGLRGMRVEVGAAPAILVGSGADVGGAEAGTEEDSPLQATSVTPIITTATNT